MLYPEWRTVDIIYSIIPGLLFAVYLKILSDVFCATSRSSITLDILYRFSSRTLPIMRPKYIEMSFYCRVKHRYCIQKNAHALCMSILRFSLKGMAGWIYGDIMLKAAYAFLLICSTYSQMRNFYSGLLLDI